MTESLLVDRVIQAGTEPQLESVCEKWKGCHWSDAGGQSPGRRKLVEEEPGRGLTQRHARKSTAAQERKRGMKVTDGNGGDRFGKAARTSDEKGVGSQE